MGFIIDEMQDDFTAFLERLFPRIVGFVARRIRGSREDAENLAQETLILAWQNRDGLAPASEPARAAFLFRTALNLARNHERKGWRRAILDRLSDALRPTASPEPSSLPSDYRQALAVLPEDKREVVRLRLEEDLDYETIGEVMGIPTGTAKSRYFHAAIELRKALATYMDG